MPEFKGIIDECRKSLLPLGNSKTFEEIRKKPSQMAESLCIVSGTLMGRNDPSMEANKNPGLAETPEDSGKIQNTLFNSSKSVFMGRLKNCFLKLKNFLISKA